MDKGTIARIAVALLLAGAAATLFLMNRREAPPPAAVERDRGGINAQDVGALDRDVDTVLARFGIEQTWVRKREVAIPNTSWKRLERRVAIPVDVVPIQVNHALNTVAKRYHGRAVASENSKENTLTIHLELGGIILQTIILKPNSQLRRGERSSLPSAA